MTTLTIIEQGKGWEFSSPLYEKQELLYINKLIDNIKKNGFLCLPTLDNTAIDIKKKGDDFFCRLVFLPHKHSENSSQYIVNPLNDNFLTLLPLSTNNIQKEKNIINKAIQKTKEEYPRVSPIDELEYEVFEQIWNEHFNPYVSKNSDVVLSDNLIKKISNDIAEESDFFNDEFCVNIANDYKKKISQFSDDFNKELKETLKELKANNNDINMNKIGQKIIGKIIYEEIKERYNYELSSLSFGFS